MTVTLIIVMIVVIIAVSVRKHLWKHMALEMALREAVKDNFVPGSLVSPGYFTQVCIVSGCERTPLKDL